jgi:dihydroneopterin aldolase
MELVVKNLRKTFNTHVTKSIKWRKHQLNQLLKLIEENSEELCDSLMKDLNKVHKISINSNKLEVFL